MEDFMAMNENFERVRINEYSGTLYPKQRTDEIGVSALLMVFRRMFHFVGYTSRREFWWGILLLTILNYALIWFIGNVLFEMGAAGIFISLALSFIPFFATLSLLFRRYGDANVYRAIPLIILLAGFLNLISVLPTVAYLVIIAIVTYGVPLLPTSKMVDGVVTNYSSEAE